jgi:ATP-dependent Clp protease ATP-binding subunit ClpC
MNTISLNLAWSLAEMEASEAGFSSITPNHFWIGCCKGCDLDLSKFLSDAKPEIKAQEEQIRQEFKMVANSLQSVDISPVEMRRALRKSLGKVGAPSSRPISRHPDLRVAFKEGANLASMYQDPLSPSHVLHSLLSHADDTLDHCIGLLGKEKKAFKEKLEDQLLTLIIEDGENRMTLREKAKKPKESPIRKPQPPDKPVKRSVLSKYGRDLTQLAKDGKLSPLIGRKEEMLRIAQTLLQSRKSNVILVGEPGVGKTGIVEGLAQRIAEGKAPDEIKDARIIELSIPILVAGTQYRGEFEERIQAVIQEASADPNIILFLDEIHTLMGAGKCGGSLDAANILKPALARGEIRVIGATTIAEYRLHIEKDPAMERRFLKVDIEEPSPKEAIEILERLRSRMEKHHGITITADAIDAAVKWSVRYLPDFRLPDKAIDLLDTACAQARFLSFSGSRGGVTVDRAQVAEAVASRCKIPVGSLTEDEEKRLLSMEDILALRVKGQKEAIKKVSEAVRLARAGLGNPNRPVGSFLFVGPSGTGKTELAKTLAEFLFQSESSLIRFDMSEFMEEHSVSKLIGAPPGYKGYDEEGQLTGKIRTHPYSVLLFDEIEKAHPRVLDLFLQIFDEGTLTDSKGRKCSFRDAIIIMTSNLGVGSVAKKWEMGFGVKPRDDEDVRAEMRERINEAIKKHLRPELINRLSAVVQFKVLRDEEIRLIVLKCITDLNNCLADRGITINLAPGVTDCLIREGSSTEYGARELERTVERLITKPFSQLLLSSENPWGTEYVVSLNDGVVTFLRVK